MFLTPTVPPTEQDAPPATPAPARAQEPATGGLCPAVPGWAPVVLTEACGPGGSAPSPNGTQPARGSRPQSPHTSTHAAPGAEKRSDSDKTQCRPKQSPGSGWVWVQSLRQLERRREQWEVCSAGDHHLRGDGRGTGGGTWKKGTLAAGHSRTQLPRSNRGHHRSPRHWELPPPRALPPEGQLSERLQLWLSDRPVMHVQTLTSKGKTEGNFLTHPVG